MIHKIGEFIFFIFALFVSIGEIRIKNIDYHIYTVQERIDFFCENQDDFEHIVNYCLENTNPYEPLDSVYVYEIERNDKVSFKEIKKIAKEKIMIHHKDDDNFVVIKFNSGTPGFSDSGIYYSENNIYMDPNSSTLAEPDPETGKYIVYLASSSAEIIKIRDNWFLYQKAYYKDEGFLKKTSALY